MAILCVPSDLLTGDRQGVSLAAGIALTSSVSFFVLMELRAPHCRRRARRGASKLTFREGVLYLATGGVMAALTAEWFVAGFEPATEALGIPTAFAALVIIPLLGNVAENYVALRYAWAGDGEAAMSVIMHSVVQIALLMTGLLVIVSQFIGHTPLSLQLDPVLAVALGLALIVLWMIMYDGEMQPVEAVGLLAVYAILGATIWAEGSLGTRRLGPPANGSGRVGLLLADHDAVLEPHAHAPELGAARGAALLDRLGLDRVECLRDRIAQQARGALVILVRAARGLGHDGVDDAELVAEARRRLERGRRLAALVHVAPEDRRAALRRDHRVDRVLEHQHAIGDADRERAAGAALADHARHLGTRRRTISSMDCAIAAAWPACSASTPG